MTHEWMRFPARLDPDGYTSTPYEWMPRAHLAAPEGEGHRTLCWRSVFRYAPIIPGGIHDDEYEKCGLCARMGKNS